MYRQKGTGNARAGSRRSAAFAAAAVTSSPCALATIRYRLPRKAVQAATRMAIASQDCKSSDVVVIDELSFAAPKTKEMAGDPEGAEA